MRQDARDVVEKLDNGYYQYTQDMVFDQNYDSYTEEDQKVWGILYKRQMETLPGKATQEYIDGIKTVNFVADHIPIFTEVNDILKKYTNWKINVVPGLIPNKVFFELMLNGNFCATTWLRKMEELDYLEEPDMFHDVFGHVPLLTNQNLCDFLAHLSRIGLKHIGSEVAIEAVARLYWYTVEFGLIQEKAGLRIYGAGILSSYGESDYSLNSDKPQRVPYDVTHIINTPYIKDRYQEIYFVIDSFEQLYNSVAEIEEKVDELVANDVVLEM